VRCLLWVGIEKGQADGNEARDVEAATLDPVVFWTAVGSLAAVASLVATIIGIVISRQNGQRPEKPPAQSTTASQTVAPAPAPTPGTKNPPSPPVKSASPRQVTPKSWQTIHVGRTLGIIGAIALVPLILIVLARYTFPNNPSTGLQRSAPTATMPAPTATPISFLDPMTAAGHHANWQCADINYPRFLPVEDKFSSDGFYLNAIDNISGIDKVYPYTECVAPIDSSPVSAVYLRTAVSISVHVKQLQGGERLGYGILWGTSASSKVCSIQINSAAQWGAVCAEPYSDHADVVHWTSNSIIRRGLNASNFLEVTVDGQHYVVSVNGVRVGEGEESFPAPALLGVTSNYQAGVLFSNFSITP